MPASASGMMQRFIQSKNFMQPSLEERAAVPQNFQAKSPQEQEALAQQLVPPLRRLREETRKP